VDKDVQVIIVQFGDATFFTVALTFDQWLWSLLFGIGDLLYAQVTGSQTIIPVYTYGLPVALFCVIWCRY